MKFAIVQRKRLYTSWHWYTALRWWRLDKDDWQIYNLWLFFKNKFVKIKLVLINNQQSNYIVWENKRGDVYLLKEILNNTWLTSNVWFIPSIHTSSIIHTLEHFGITHTYTCACKHFVTRISWHFSVTFYLLYTKINININTNFVSSERVTFILQIEITVFN